MIGNITVERFGRNMVIAACIFIAALFLLVGCSSGPATGTITKKEYIPESSYTTMMYCGQNCWMPVINTDPECYKLNLKNNDKTGSVCIDENRWKTVKVGDWWNGQ